MARLLVKKELDLANHQKTSFKFRPASEKELKALGDDLPDGYIAGWASTPDLDHYAHVVTPGAFDKSILAKGLSGPKGIKLLIGHNTDKPAGVIKVLETRGGSLWIEAQMNLNISYVKDSHEAAKMQGGLSFSVGFLLEDYEFKVNDRKEDYLLIKQGELMEVSIVLFPGNDNAEMLYIKTDESDLEGFPDFEKALMALGIVKSRNDAQRVTRVVKRLPEFRKKPPVQVSDKTVNKLRDVLEQLQSALKD